MTALVCLKSQCMHDTPKCIKSFVAINILLNNTIMKVKMRRNWKTSDTFTKKHDLNFSCPSSGPQQLTLIYIFVRSLRLDIKPTVSCNMFSAIGLKLIFIQSNKKCVTENCVFMQRRCLLDIYVFSIGEKTFIANNAPNADWPA